MEGKVVAVCISRDKGTKKENVGSGVLLEGFGLEGDAHAGAWHRQVSLLAMESIDKLRQLGLDVGPGGFAENITTEGIDLLSLPIGTKLRVGEGCLLEVTQVGKECYDRCAIYYQVGDCVMPREGIFARVIKGGPIKKDDAVEVVKEGKKGV